MLECHRFSKQVFAKVSVLSSPWAHWALLRHVGQAAAAGIAAWSSLESAAPRMHLLFHTHFTLSHTFAQKADVVVYFTLIKSFDPCVRSVKNPGFWRFKSFPRKDLKEARVERGKIFGNFFIFELGEGCHLTSRQQLSSRALSTAAAAVNSPRIAAIELSPRFCPIFAFFLSPFISAYSDIFDILHFDQFNPCNRDLFTFWYLQVAFIKIFHHCKMTGIAMIWATILANVWMQHRKNVQNWKKMSVLIIGADNINCLSTDPQFVFVFLSWIFCFLCWNSWLEHSFTSYTTINCNFSKTAKGIKSKNNRKGAFIGLP